MGITARTGKRALALAAGLAAAASVAGAVSATAFANTTTPTAPTCAAGTLSLRSAGTDTGVGSTAMTIVVTSHSARACELHGYPAVRAIRANGQPGALAAHGHGSIFGAPAVVRLAPGGHASFFIYYSDFSSTTGQPGTPATALRAALPSVSGTFTVPAQFAPAGSLTTSPIRAGAHEE